MATGERFDAFEPPSGSVSIVLDTDAYNEIDDQYAIAYALSATGIDVEGIYAAPFHNARSAGPGDGMTKSHAELQRVLDGIGQTPSDGVFDGRRRICRGTEHQTVIRLRTISSSGHANTRR